MKTTPLTHDILKLPACELKALTITARYQAGEAIDWTQATAAMQELRNYTESCKQTTKAILTIRATPAEDTELLFTSIL